MVYTHFHFFYPFWHNIIHYFQTKLFTTSYFYKFNSY